jgi:hypothetical protein
LRHILRVSIREMAHASLIKPRGDLLVAWRWTTRRGKAVQRFEAGGAWVRRIVWRRCGSIVWLCELVENSARQTQLFLA